ncbi:hypothetical protein [Deinococcus sp. YIM 77859]|uniref:hypothetical protein n=1 Tax=Deinococcus sp. YIM 77859 TaxID=1540221 RepID=UPI000ABCFB9A|nr:hypothetical protein [Deinococcus sp. YIM 77859]
MLQKNSAAGTAARKNALKMQLLVNVAIQMIRGVAFSFGFMHDLTLFAASRWAARGNGSDR